MTKEPLTIVWFRNDLRLHDNPAWHFAVKAGPTLPVFIVSDEDDAPWPLGAASRSWLHHSLAALSEKLKACGSALHLYQGRSADILLKVAEESGASAVFWNRRYDPQLIKNDKKVKVVLESAGLSVKSFNASLLKEPWETLNKTKQPYQVFTPFWRARLQDGHDTTELSAPRNVSTYAGTLASLPLSALNLLPKIPWDKAFYESWVPGEDGARQQLRGFAKAVDAYGEDRNRPDRIGTSRLSPHLHFGEISPRTVWNFLKEKSPKLSASYLREIGWREFSYYLLYHFPDSPDVALKKQYEAIQWVKSKKQYVAWCRGQTGYPIVDAGMRELWHTGWMHNRVRMVVASFLIKDLLMDWRKGAAWFWDTLVDADLANNTQGWQWTAGCGADASPFFRVFNPVLQGKKFDPDGTYVKKWLPELMNVPTAHIHEPWAADEALLNKAGVTLGKTYPKRVVEHDVARHRALKEYDRISKKT